MRYKINQLLSESEIGNVTRAGSGQNEVTDVYTCLSFSLPALNTSRICVMTMTAFCTPSLIQNSRSTSLRDGPKMCARTPGDENPNPSLYSQYIDSSRLNKAPILTINNFGNEDYNSVGLELKTLARDLPAAASLKVDVDRGHARTGPTQANPTLWSKYYSASDVNKAPFVFVNGSYDRANDCAVGVAFTDVPLQVDAPQQILDSIVQLENSDAAPLADKGSLMPNAGDNMAPIITLNDRGDPDGADSVGLEMVDIGLNEFVAESLLKKYRRD